MAKPWESQYQYLTRQTKIDEHISELGLERATALANVWVNYHFLGCSYPEGAMKAINSWGPPPKDRKFEECLKLVKEREKLAEYDTDHVNDDLQVSSLDIRFIEGLENGNSISLLYNSCQKSKKTLEFINSREGNQYKVSLKINDLHVADGIASNIKDAKHVCAENAVKFLKSRGIKKFKTHQNSIAEDAVAIITKDTLTGKMEPLKIDDDNMGSKLLKMMGWTGTGLGKDEQGIVNPISSVGQTSRGGLGSSSSEFAISKQSVQERLLAFLRDPNLEKLEFSKDLDNTERKIIHQLSKRYHLMSKSRGKGENRQLVVWKPLNKTDFMIDSIVDYEDSEVQSSSSGHHEQTSHHMAGVFDSEEHEDAQRTTIAFDYDNNERSRNARDRSKYKRGQGNVNDHGRSRGQIQIGGRVSRNQGYSQRNQEQRPYNCYYNQSYNDHLPSRGHENNQWGHRRTFQTRGYNNSNNMGYDGSLGANRHAS